MKCPNCGKEMVLDGHRKIDLMMCYNCGYIEGRRLDQPSVSVVKSPTLIEEIRNAEKKAGAWLKSVNL